MLKVFVTSLGVGLLASAIAGKLSIAFVFFSITFFGRLIVALLKVVSGENRNLHFKRRLIH